MAAIVTPGDITPFASIEPTKLAAMIKNAEAMAALAAPCIKDPAFAVDGEDRLDQVRAIIVGAILRWEESGTGAKIAQSAGPFQTTLDTTNQRRSMFWPSEISDLRAVCAQFTNKGRQKAFTIDTAPGVPAQGIHAPWCDVYFGLNGYGRPPFLSGCSCGSDLNNYLGPIYEEPT